MRRAHYSGRVAHSLDWGGSVRTLLILLALGAALWWLVTGPALAWLQSFADLLPGR